MDSVIKIENLKKSFPLGFYKSHGSKTVLKNINLEIEKGKIYALAGKNGAGKSTLLKVITNLLLKDSGELTVLGERITNNSYKYLSKIGAVIEEPKFYETRVKEDLEIYCRQRGIYNNENLIEQLKIFNLEQYLYKKIKDLSTGNKQKLAILRAMVSEPELLLLDEPFNYIDPKGVFEIKNLLLKCNKELNATIIISTHLLRDVEDLIDELIIIDDGVIKDKITITDIRKLRNDSIRLTVDNISKALVIIEREFKTKNYTVIDDQIILFGKLDNQKNIVKTLVDNDILVEEICKEIGSIEKYYLNKTNL